MGELERVVLTIDLAEHGLKTDDIGTVVLVHGENQGYEVEFVTLTGETVAVVSSRSQTLFASFPNSVCLVPKLCLPRSQTLFGDADISETLFQWAYKQSLQSNLVPKLQVGNQ
jgi:hypothetical protein